MIAFIQPFGVQGAGGGSRILRGLLECDHPPVISLYTGVHDAPPSTLVEEQHVVLRPRFGRLEKTRFHRSLSWFDRPASGWLQARFRRIFKERGVQVVHIIPHEYDFIAAVAAAKSLGLPYFLTIHDDLEYTALGHPWIDRMTASLRDAWRGAAGAFVISDAIGEEYNRRYGPREFTVITDGLTEVAAEPQPRPGRSLRVYFMGLFNFRYKANLRALLDALKIIRAQHPDWDLSVVSRSAKIFGDILPDDVPVSVLPYGPESIVQQDMQSADLLYQPLPFEAEAASFGKFSLSTKMVTYLGSGLPILYHGPADTAANELLSRHNAAVLCTSLDAETIAAQLVAASGVREQIVTRALALAREQFMLVDQQRRFWTPLRTALR